MGTMIQRHKLGEADYRGERFKDHPKSLKGNSDLLQLTRPDVDRGDPRARTSRAGADIVETNTFGATSVAQADYDLGALRPRDERRRRAAGARGLRQVQRAPTSRASSPARSGRRRRRRASAPTSTTRRRATSPSTELRDAYREQAEGLLEGGCDLFLVETIFDTLNAKAAIFALDELMEESGERLPVIVSGTVTDASGRILSGQTVRARSGTACATRGRSRSASTARSARR